MMNFFLKATADEVVPLLRRMEEAVGEGKSVKDAYAEALHETRMLKHVVGEPSPDLPFGAALLDAASRSKLRPLAGLAESVLLGADAPAADPASTAARQRKLLLLVGAAGLVGLLVARRSRR